MTLAFVKRTFQFVFLAVVMAYTLGCSTLGAPTPQTPTQVVAQADGAFSGVISAAAELRAAGRFRESTVDTINDMIQRGDQALRLAWSAVHDGQPIDSHVQRVLSVVAELQSIVEEAER